MVLLLLNAIEKARHYALESDNFNQPDYSHAFQAFVNIVVSISALKLRRMMQGQRAHHRVKT
jgi:hypothetical protein